MAVEVEVGRFFEIKSDEALKGVESDGDSEAKNASRRSRGDCTFSSGVREGSVLFVGDSGSRPYNLNVG